MPIRLLTAVDSLSLGDNFAIGSANNGDDRKASGSVLVTFLESALDFSPSGAFPDYITQYAAPSATGFSVQITDADDNIHLILMPVAAYAAGTIIFPLSTNLVDKQEVLVNTTQAVTALTLNGNGATIQGAPTSLVANSFFRFKYDISGNTWYLIGSGDATSVGGYVVATTATADTIVLRDSNADIFGRVLSSGVATGTAPLIVASTTKVANLNADLLDDLNSATASTINTIAARDGSGNLTANVLVSDVAIGTAPLTVTSTTVVPNLNVDQTDGYDADETDTGSTLAARDATGDIQANAFESTVATGTAPLTVASTTAVSNLNSDQTDGYDADETDTASTLAARDANGDIQANAFESTVATGTAPLTVASTTLVSNLNADSIDGYDSQISPGASTVSVRDTDDYLQATNFISGQGAPAAKTTSTTLTAAELADQIITVNQGAGAPSALQLPTGANMDTEFDTLVPDQSFDFSLINISAVAAETASITTNTGWTLVGNMLVAANTAITDISQGRFRARQTAAATWTLYRIA